ncbi:MAG: hypothetical protein GY903_04855 [Fuerstiella sp.]|nr:hypothetical protein [Fuerstiella sp.]MCP4853804.1 hypothetical protein [Fuerstiella sp.]
MNQRIQTTLWSAFSFFCAFTSLSDAAEFKVADFAAVGDGQTDDAPAVRKALAAAVEAGSGSKVTFEKKTYRFARQPGDAILALNGATGITLEGNGAEIIGNPYNSFLSIRNCQGITMRGFVLDCDPLSFTQGDIIEVVPEEGAFVLKIHEGYANPVELGEQLRKKAWDRVGFTIEAKERRLKKGPIDFIEKITELDRGESLLRVDLQAESFSHIVAGDRFVMGLHHGGSGALIHVTASTDIRLEDYTIHGGKYGMNHVFSDNHGRFHVKGAKIAFRPGSDRLVTSIKDGFHVKHNRLGPIIEDCLLEGMMDDSINISVCPYWVKKDLGENRYLIAELQFSPRVGDRLMAYTPVPGTVARGLKLLAVEPQVNARGPRGAWNIITLDQPIPELALHQGGNLFPGGHDKLRFTGLYNLDACGQGYIVRNNTFLAQRRHALLARGSGGLFEGNTIDGIGGAGVNLGNEIGNFYEGPFPSETTIRDNSFRNTLLDPIRVYAKGRNALAKNITIENNTFSEWPAAAMQLSNLQGGVIDGNTIERGKADAAGVVPIVVKHSSGVRIRGNVIRDRRTELAAVFDLSDDVDAASLLMSGNRMFLGAGFPRLMQVVPAPFIQPRDGEIRPLRAAEGTGAYLQGGFGEVSSGKGPVWSLHPPWKKDLKGAILFDLPTDFTGAEAIRFDTRSATGMGDGVVLTVAWRPIGAPDSAYQNCHTRTIREMQWTPTRVAIETTAPRVMLRFSFDCGSADNSSFDTVQIASLDLISRDDGLLRIADYGAVGDGVHDDGPAITAAFAGAKEDDCPSTVVFENKVYRLGDNPAAWHYFQMEDHKDLTVEGRGATLILSKANLGFHFSGGRNIKLRGLTFDTDGPRFTQGEVVALDERGTLDVRIMDGYPAPPDEAFLTANKHKAHGGGGRHMIVFENGGNARNTRMGSDHLYIHNITRVAPDVFRFHVKEDYVLRMKGIAVGNWISYGFNKANLPATEKAAKDRSASIYAQIAADRVENITFEDIDIFGSLNGGIRVSDMPGDVTLRDVRIIRKPGTRNLLSIISDALHLMNIRGRVIMEDCEIEAAGDDCLNIGAQRDNLISLDASDRKIVILRSTDNWYYDYTIREGDRLQFLDTASKKVLGVRTVRANAFSPRNRAHRVTLDREVEGLLPGTTQVMNLNHITQSTVIRNNTITPYMRNALLARAQNMTVEGNRLDCSRGGVIGLNLNFASGQDGARLRNVRVADNTFVCPDNVGLVAWRPYRDKDGVPDTRELEIIDNVFQVDSAKAIRLRGVKGLRLWANRIMKNRQALPVPSGFIEIGDCIDVVLESASPITESGR